MLYLFLIAITILLFLAFMTLTLMEARTGTRALAVPRARLDQWVLHAEFVMEHVNWGEFVAHMLQGLLARIAHDVVHFTLMAVRFLERQLTRALRALRDRRPNVLAPEPSRPPVAEQIRAYIQRMVGRKKQ